MDRTRRSKVSHRLLRMHHHQNECKIGKVLEEVKAGEKTKAKMTGTEAGAKTGAGTDLIGKTGAGTVSPRAKVETPETPGTAGIQVAALVARVVQRVELQPTRHCRRHHVTEHAILRRGTAETLGENLHAFRCENLCVCEALLLEDPRHEDHLQDPTAAEVMEMAVQLARVTTVPVLVAAIFALRAAQRAGQLVLTEAVTEAAPAIEPILVRGSPPLAEALRHRPDRRH